MGKAVSDQPAPATGRQLPGSGARSHDSFSHLAEPYRRQIKAHCYRMSGSLHEAEDLVQETYLQAWRSFGSFEGRGSFKAWLFQIATRQCLDALRKRRRRLLPELASAPAGKMPEGEPAMDIAWLEPYPDSELDRVADDAPDPAARYALRQSVRLAFVAAIQHLPPRQRAILLLIDVVGWSPGETASLIGGSVASVNSALQRARSALARLYPNAHADRPNTGAINNRDLLERYVTAWEAKDLEGFVALLKEDAVYAMPPWPQWYLGRRSIRTFFGTVWPRYGRFRLLDTAANGQPAFALYTEAEKAWNAHSIHLLEFEKGDIAKLTLFMGPLARRLIPAFGLSLSLPV